MVPYLNASGINYVRNTPDMTAASSIKASNSGSYDFHFAIHSNASGAGNGNVQGAEFYYAPNSYNGQRAAQIFANNFKEIYPLPERVRTVPTTTLGEVVRTSAGLPSKACRPATSRQVSVTPTQPIRLSDCSRPLLFQQLKARLTGWK